MHDAARASAPGPFSGTIRGADASGSVLRSLTRRSAAFETRYVQNEDHTLLPVPSCLVAISLVQGAIAAVALTSLEANTREIGARNIPNTERLSTIVTTLNDAPQLCRLSPGLERPISAMPRPR